MFQGNRQQERNLGGEKNHSGCLVNGEKAGVENLMKEQREVGMNG